MDDTLNNSRLLSIVIIILQISYILSFLLFIYRDDIYGKFVICTSINIVSMLLSVCNLKTKSSNKMLLALISILQILFTIYVYILPDEGIPAPIQLW
ncbi:hypothetical protein [Romboutsia lituseburensis]|uniref:hypothetical protein n=1 Tax=Romboutsia lituseburensis TaxID=1537 RepID=UPI00215AF05A|nr:hypothetical protein [Romboutsia lituseburensis]MCR8747097.1 hypothetical protein [Romboutsia lituseburensis]